MADKPAPSRFTLLGLLAALALSSVVQQTHAQSAAPLPSSAAPSVPPQPDSHARFSLELRGGDGCPNAADFAADVIRRVPSAQLVAPELADIGFQVELSNGGASSLKVVLAEGSSRRELHDASCEEAAATLALIAALVIDARPEERLQSTELAPAPAEPAPAPVQAPPPKPQPPEARVAVPPPSPAPAPKPTRLRFGLNLGVGFESAVAATPPPAGVVGIGVLGERRSAWSPELRAELVATTKSTVTNGPADVTLHLLAGRLNACPLRFTPLPPLHLVPCGVLDVGQLAARGGASISGTPNNIEWLAAGVALRGELQLTPWLSLELSGSSKRVIYDDKFTVLPNDLLIYDIPKVSWGLLGGVSARL